MCLPSDTLSKILVVCCLHKLKGRGAAAHYTFASKVKDFSSKKLERANMNLSREEVLRATTRESPRLSIWPRPPAPWLFLALGPWRLCQSLSLCRFFAAPAFPANALLLLPDARVSQGKKNKRTALSKIHDTRTT